MILSALESRFSEEIYPLLCSTDCLLRPSVGLEQMQQLLQLHINYASDLDKVQIFIKYRLFCRLDQGDTMKRRCLHSIYSHLIKNDLASYYPNLSLLPKLLLTLPVSSSSCERYFSTLKIVKTS